MGFYIKVGGHIGSLTFSAAPYHFDSTLAVPTFVHTTFSNPYRTAIGFKHAHVWMYEATTLKLATFAGSGRAVALDAKTNLGCGGALKGIWAMWISISLY